MIKPAETLLVARFVFQEYDWRLHKGRVSRIATNAFDEIEIYFDLKDPGDQQDACIALTSRGWTITEHKQDGKPYWKATKHGKGKLPSRGEIKNQSLQRVIVQAVEEENGEA
jgi:hypothetical protein